jgi:hypothetical protein
MIGAASLDLIVLVPGKDERETLDGLLSARCSSLGIRPVRHEILVHPRRDPGCFHEAPAVLQTYQRRAHHALVVLDHEGSGQEDRSPAQVAADLLRRMNESGWGNRAAAIVIEPELEIWVWSDSPHVDRVFGWQGRPPGLRQWLAIHGFWPEGQPKPARPKEGLLKALRQASVQRSSALYRQLAEKVSLERCHDASFQQLKEVLVGWFPARGDT